MKTLSPSKKRLALLSLIPALLVGGLIISWVFKPAPFQIPPRPPLPSPNGFDAYVKATQAIVPANPPVDPINDAKRPTPQQAATQYSPQRRRAWIAANATTWKLMDEAKTLPCYSPDIRGLLPTPLYWGQFRELARCQSIRVKEAKTSGKWGEAANLGLDTIEMGLNTERGSVLIGSLVSIAIEAIGQRSIEDVPSHLSATEAKTTARRLETMLDKAQPFSEVLTEEKWSMAASIGRTGGGSGAGIMGKIGSLYFSRAMAETVAMMDSLIAEANKPAGAQTQVAAPTGLTSTLASMNFPVMKRSFFNDERRKSAERLLLLQLALRAYRAERGAYPTQLSQLAPTYLKSVPVDPFGKGEPLHYAVKGDSYTLWSIGPDGIDDKGISIKPKPPQKRPIASINSKGDIVVHP
ncbi:hypothetical protein EON83_21710 [bacterium]|nr:MAG: hypothetical protein EON83_21710 [bacterium]